MAMANIIIRINVFDYPMPKLAMFLAKGIGGASFGSFGISDAYGVSYCPHTNCYRECLGDIQYSA